MARRALALTAVVIGVWVIGCQSIAGIEDRTYQPGVTGSAECEAYCDQVMSNCTGALAAYPNRDLCILTCDTFPAGELEKDNSLDCRANQAQNTPSEPDFYCKGAGPFGAGACGPTCDAYCTLVSAFCPETLADSDCAASCPGLREDGVYDYSVLDSGDSVECRLAYAVRASLDKDNEEFCPGAALKSTLCADPVATLPNCTDYCRLVQTVCTGTNVVYESSAQCMAVCALMDKGLNTDTTGDTVGCRKYHSYNAISGASSHCPHAGPGGDGHCGPTCPSYCKLLSQVCPTEFSSSFKDDGDCQFKCLGIAGGADDTYFKAFSTKDTMRCRMTNVSRAAETASTTACAAAVGGGECAP